MAETIHDGKWHWYSVEADLREQGCEVVIDPPFSQPLSVTGNFCSGHYGSNPFHISWASDFCLFVTMQQFSQRLIDAFSQVVEYQPFCKYKWDGMITVGWIRRDVSNQYIEVLKEDEAISDIVLLK